MKRFIPLIMLLMAAPANAGGLVHKMSSSVQLTVDSARTTATRLGSQYSVSGSNVNTTDGSTAGTISAGTLSSGIYSPGTISATQKLLEKHSPLVLLIFRAMQFPPQLLL